MDLIVHEQQEGCLCAQHCLNALLQGSYFTPVDLSVLGQQMDDEERKRMAECGVDSDEYKTFLKQPSGNMDDSGFFSVQVISSALEVWGLELVPYLSSHDKAVEAREHPENMHAYICNFKQHWLTIRKLGNQWFNLNSLLSGPELISNTYLGMFLAQLQNDGYSIFIVIGNLPSCQADEVLKLTTVVAQMKPMASNKDHYNQSKPNSTSTVTSAGPLSTEPITSLSGPTTSSTSSNTRIIPITIEDDDDFNEDENEDIQRAINLSLGIDEFTTQSSPNETITNIHDNETTSQQSINQSSSSILLNNQSNVLTSCGNQSTSVGNLSREISYDEDLQNAIRLSMEPFKTDQTNSS